MCHELEYCSKPRVVLVLSGKSVITVGARCADVPANELVVRRCCTVTWNSAHRCTKYVTCVGTWWQWIGLTSECQSHMDVVVELVGRGLAATISVCVVYVAGFAMS